MGFLVAFEPGAASGEPAEINYDYDYESIVMEVCEALGERHDAKFTLSGFGRDPWPVDVPYDMSVFVEQLPDLLENLRTGDLFRLDMYSQGIEAKLEFVPNADDVAITCTSRTSWSPEPSTEHIGLTQLLDMLDALATVFARAALEVGPGLAAQEPFATWSTGAAAGD